MIFIDLLIFLFIKIKIFVRVSIKLTIFEFSYLKYFVIIICIAFKIYLIFKSHITNNCSSPGIIGGVRTQFYQMLFLWIIDADE